MGGDEHQNTHPPSPFIVEKKESTFCKYSHDLDAEREKECKVFLSLSLSKSCFNHALNLGLAEVLASINAVRAELFLNTQELIVLCKTL